MIYTVCVRNKDSQWAKQQMVKETGVLIQKTEFGGKQEGEALNFRRASGHFCLNRAH